jgi:hypothetical protein
MYKPDLELLRSTRARTFAMVSGLSQAQMDYEPAPGRWSIGEILDHLLLSEEYFRNEILQLIEMKKAGRRPILTRTFADLNFSLAFMPKFALPLFEIPFSVFNIFVPSFVREFMIRNRIIPAQNADAAAPRKGRKAAELCNELERSLRKTEAVFESNPNLDYRQMREQHPLLGDNDVLQLIRLVALHEQRHQAQISDILANPRFPKASQKLAVVWDNAEHPSPSWSSVPLHDKKGSKWKIQAPRS